MVEFLLIRHGETDYNKDIKFYGLSDVGLNENGISQARSLSTMLKREKIGMIYSSDLKRCVETCGHIGFDKDIRFSDALREMNFGIWEGLTYKEVKSRYPEQLASWESDWINYLIQDGESYAAMSARVIAFFELIRTEAVSNVSLSGKKIVLVTHGGCIRAILGNYIIGAVKDAWRFIIDNAAVTRLSFNKEYVYLKSLNER